ncbi:DNA mismatch repair endonuclease MutL [Legionella maceachernii]|uniref:DNA mismatch repair protein MutL n=1 Tax=Legionella maceachernii TaxID=466 RepID=A0A0W0VZ25_9GAMM|nr:DNA mismatch repair endonuclease MutL [Legionella maceachernii]KTD25540.1 DNA mismatch repair protein MutL [Legionella maceachernii]SJZ55701.1 DNA mismatch repair protein MutL [Legionella maceachernii]SUP00451.1 DNA mismatch repair protein mutL [Legionella maceachernii]
MRIQQLPTAVANQIAAGEVIERPASVVKELLENAFDAQADIITIDISYGGLNQIKISDNGIGIVAEDLPLAIAAHATSKINELKDLYAISSMGFRGEALASIASVSRLMISSKPANQPHAMMLSMTDGDIQLTPCARSQGTTIDVRDIFFNAPVRKKFLKSEQIEFQAIEMMVRRFALSAPGIAISLSHNGKQQFNLPAANNDKTQLARIRKLLGKNFIEQSQYLDIEHAGLQLKGWISTSAYQRSQNDKQWVYVNKRMVKDKLLNHAIKQAYEGVLYPGRYPACLLYLTINPEEVDVNVHPTKHEVRFQQPRLVHDFICSHIQKALHQSQLAVDYTHAALPVETSSSQVRELYLPLLHPATKVTDVSNSKKNWLVLNSSFALIFLNKEPYVVNVIELQRAWLFSVLSRESLPLPSRPLLVPVSYPVNALSLERIDSYREALSQIGMELDLAGEQTVLIRSLPTAIPHLDLKQFLLSILSSAPPTITRLIELLTMCQSFSAQNAREEEIETLIGYLETLGNDKLDMWCKHLSMETCRGLLNA